MQLRQCIVGFWQTFFGLLCQSPWEHHQHIKMSSKTGLLYARNLAERRFLTCSNCDISRTDLCLSLWNWSSHIGQLCLRTRGGHGDRYPHCRPRICHCTESRFCSPAWDEYTQALPCCSSSRSPQPRCGKSPRNIGRFSWRDGRGKSSRLVVSRKRLLGTCSSGSNRVRTWFLCQVSLGDPPRTLEGLRMEFCLLSLGFCCSDSCSLGSRSWICLDRGCLHLCRKVESQRSGRREVCSLDFPWVKFCLFIISVYTYFNCQGD